MPPTWRGKFDGAEQLIDGLGGVGVLRARVCNDTVHWPGLPENHYASAQVGEWLAKERCFAIDRGKLTRLVIDRGRRAMGVKSDVGCGR